MYTTHFCSTRRLATIGSAAIAVCFSQAAAAQSSASPPPAAPAAAAQAPAATSPDPVTPYVNARYRLETVDQEGIAESALASTLRVRAGVRTAQWHGLSAVLEGEAIVRLGPEDYNDTVNGRTAFPVVADPSDIVLNQAFVRWQPAQQVEATVGRQAINLDNQRWVGSVDWRQNDQTLDAVRAAVSPSRNTRLDYVHSWRVNRIFGPDSPQGIWRDTDIHLLRGSVTLAPVGTLSAYGYWLDLPSAPALSSRTLGLRLSGQQAVGGSVTLHYAAELARQRDNGVNPARFSHDYLLIEPGLGAGPVTVRVGYERLSGDGSTALQTPLATLHAFNGWTDRFLTTPVNGLRDLYTDVQWRLGPVLTSAPATLRLQVHDFNATRTGTDYGREYGAWLIVPVSSQISSSVKLSHYDADAFATDTTKFWFSVDFRF